MRKCQLSWQHIRRRNMLRRVQTFAAYAEPAKVLVRQRTVVIQYVHAEIGEHENYGNYNQALAQPGQRSWRSPRPASPRFHTSLEHYTPVQTNMPGSAELKPDSPFSLSVRAV